MGSNQKPAKNAIKILIVEDSPTQAVQLRFLLQEQGYQVIVAADGQQGLVAARQHQPQLIISDVLMPIMDGYAMCEALKLDQMLAHIPVMLLTTLSDSGKIIRGLMARADYYLTKPYDEKFLLTRVETILTRPVRSGEEDPAELFAIIDGQHHLITAERSQMLSLLMSVYEDAIQQNRELEKTRKELQELNEQLEERVGQRTLELRATSEALRKSEEKYYQLYNNAPDIFFSVDPETKLIIQCNQALIANLGYSKEEIIGCPVFDLFHPDCMAEARSAFETFKKTGQIRNAEVQFKRKDGTKIVGDLNVSAIRDEAGKIIYGNSIWRDITERKEAEERLRQITEGLQRSNTELEQIAYVAAHDLQEPLRMVSSYVQLLARRYQGQLDADADEFIGFAVDGANRLKTLINDLLAYSSVGTWGEALKPTACEAALEQALTNLQLALAESGAVVTHDPLPTVTADQVQLSHLFQNLIGNGLKFRSPSPPEIHVGVGRRTGEHHWLFSVRDNGIGLEPQYAERIFVIFQRLHDRDAYTGTGIGLAICKKIVERHGGRIWVESKPGVGSTFYFTIPIKEANHNE
jgi:PAS domain S-box-containing protein